MPRNPLRVVVCRVCPTVFTTRIRTQVYCSSACRNRRRSALPPSAAQRQQQRDRDRAKRQAAGPRSKGRTGAAWRRTTKRLRVPGAVCVLCTRPIDVTLPWPHPLSFSVQHLDGNKDNNDPSNHAPAHLTCNIRHGNAMRRGRDRSVDDPREVRDELIVDAAAL